MKPIKIIAFILLVMFSGKVEAQSVTASKLLVPLSEPGKPYKLNVDLQLAIVNVSVYDGKDIAIDIASIKKKEQRSENKGMVLIHSSSSNDIVAQEKNNVVTITDGPSGNGARVVVNIKIPAGATTLKLSVSDGTLAASNISGTIEANDLHGNISLTNVSGSVVANSNQGNIKVIFKSVDANSAMAFSTFRGTIDITLPAGVKVNTKLRSDYGSIFSDFDIVPEKTENKVDKAPENGVYRVTSNDWIYGKINGGGQELMIKSYRGNIYLRKAK